MSRTDWQAKITFWKKTRGNDVSPPKIGQAKHTRLCCTLSQAT